MLLKEKLPRQVSRVTRWTSPSNKAQGPVASCELAIFATKSSRRDQNLVPVTSPMNSNWFEFMGLVADATRF